MNGCNGLVYERNRHTHAIQIPSQTRPQRSRHTKEKSKPKYGNEIGFHVCFPCTTIRKKQYISFISFVLVHYLLWCFLYTLASVCSFRSVCFLLCFSPENGLTMKQNGKLYLESARLLDISVFGVLLCNKLLARWAACETVSH